AHEEAARGEVLGAEGFAGAANGVEGAGETDLLGASVHLGEVEAADLDVGVTAAEPGVATDLYLGLDLHILDEVADHLVGDELLEGEGLVEEVEDQGVVEGDDLVLAPDLIEVEGAAVDADPAIDVGASVAPPQLDLAARRE